MACAICQTRRPRRFCPGVGGDICSICCGTEREVTVTCPFDCVFLQEARKHEKLQELDPKQMPNRDIELTDRFVEEHESVLTYLGSILLRAGLETPGVVDFDIREALEALIRTYRTLQSGVYYESVPQNPLAATVFRLVQNGIADFRNREQQQFGMARVRDAEILGVLAFLQRFELDRNNGRRRGRAFLDSLHRHYSSLSAPEEPAPPSLLIP